MVAESAGPYTSAVEQGAVYVVAQGAVIVSGDQSGLE